jgi:hypothetical protein
MTEMHLLDRQGQNVTGRTLSGWPPLYLGTIVQSEGQEKVEFVPAM